MFSSKKKEDRNKDKESGSVMLEMAITLPLVLTLAVGMIEWSTFIQQNRRIKHSLRNGVRLAADYPVDQTLWPAPTAPFCIDGSGNGSPTTCTGFTSNPSGTEGLDLYTKQAVCFYINQSGFNPEDWIVGVQPVQRIEDTVTVNFMRVDVSRNPASVPCTICWNNFWLNVAAFTEQTTFRYSGTCI